MILIIECDDCPLCGNVQNTNVLNKILSFRQYVNSYTHKQEQCMPVSLVHTQKVAQTKMWWRIKHFLHFPGKKGHIIPLGNYLSL